MEVWSPIDYLITTQELYAMKETSAIAINVVSLETVKEAGKTVLAILNSKGVERER